MIERASPAAGPAGQATAPDTPVAMCPGERYTQLNPVTESARASSTVHRSVTPSGVIKALSPVSSREGSASAGEEAAAGVSTSA